MPIIHIVKEKDIVFGCESGKNMLFVEMPQKKIY